MATAKLPTYATPGAAAFDLYAAEIAGNAGFFPNYGGVVIDTGVAVEIPPGHVMLIFSRSGHGFHNNIRLANCVGVIDSDYRGTIKVKLIQDQAANVQNIQIGDRIAQGIIVPIPAIEFEEVAELTTTLRDAGGFGSTGNQ
jgi:dUTP pyrophosphatase